MPSVKPGDVICIQAGVRSRLKFIGFQGTKEQPLIFKNCGGQVIFDRAVDNTSSEGALIFEKSRYFRVTGTGSPNHKYGFYVRKTNGSAVHATDSDYEIDHIEIADAGFAGIFAKLEALCDNVQYHRRNFVIQNVSIHDNYIHDTYGEGMYIGSSSYKGKDSPCGMLLPPEIHGLRIFNNVVENTGADGIQIGCATKDVEVYNNTIRNFGHDPFNPAQNNGLMIGGGCSGKYYNNKIIKGSGMGINCFGVGNVYMFNNLVVSPGYDGIFIDERSALFPGTGFHAHNNTIITPGRDGMRINSRNSVGNTFINNLVIKPGSLSQNYYNKSHYLNVVDDQVDYSQKNNLFLPTMEEAKFSNPLSNDYQLKPESPAINKGALLSYFNFDHDKTARPNGAAYDIGAYEFTGTVRVVNQAPVVSAGANKTITLPTNSLTLSGTASDTDGSIVSTVWSKVNGPTATLSGNTTLSLKLSNLLQGTYTFRLTAKDNVGATQTDDVTVTVLASSTSTTTNGLAYKFYTTTSSNAWRVLPDFSRLAPVKTGIVSNFSLGPKTQSDYFGFVFEGQIKIDVAGTYTFYSYSDDGSKIFINGTQVVNNDGTHGAQEKSGSVYLAVGKHNIKLTYFEYINGETLSVKYMGPGISKRLIPNTKLFPTYNATSADEQDPIPLEEEERTSDPGTSLGAPTALTASYHLKGSTFLEWTDNSNDESGFVISLSIGNNSSYKEVGSTGPDKTFYTVSSLPTDQNLYFKVRARKRLEYSKYSNEVSIIDGVSSSQEPEVRTQQDDSGTASTEAFHKIMVNFNYGTNVAAPWNNFDVDPEPQDKLANLVDIKGNQTSVSITLLTPWGWAETGSNGWNANGQTTRDDSGVFADDVLKTCFWTERTEAEELLVEGLEPNMYYSFTFCGSREANGERTTHYTIAKKTVSLDASMNTSKTVTISGAKADSNGKIKIYVRKDDNAPYGYLNAMTIEASSSTGGDEMSTTEFKGTATAAADSSSMRKASKTTASPAESFTAYPNPANDHIMVRYDQFQAGSMINIKVIDLAGAVRTERNVSATDVNGLIRIELETGTIATGYYLLQITGGEQQKTIKFLKM